MLVSTAARDNVKGSDSLRYVLHQGTVLDSGVFFLCQVAGDAFHGCKVKVPVRPNGLFLK